MGEFLAFLLLGILVVIAVVMVIVAIIRAVFRVDDAIDLLERIESHLSVLSAPKVKCDGCSAVWPSVRLKKIDSGQFLCPDCISKFRPSEHNPYKDIINTVGDAIDSSFNPRPD